MPIYAYRCESCGFAKDVLQKISDPQLTDCLSCGKPTFKKQVTAAGFQLKGTGWYATDFKGGGTPATAAAGGVVAGASGSGDGASSAPAAGDSTAKPAAATPAASTGKTESSGSSGS